MADEAIPTVQTVLQGMLMETLNPHLLKQSITYRSRVDDSGKCTVQVDLPLPFSAKHSISKIEILVKDSSADNNCLLTAKAKRAREPNVDDDTRGLIAGIKPKRTMFEYGWDTEMSTVRTESEVDLAKPLDLEQQLRKQMIPSSRDEWATDDWINQDLPDHDSDADSVCSSALSGSDVASLDDWSDDVSGEEEEKEDENEDKKEEEKELSPVLEDNTCNEVSCTDNSPPDDKTGRSVEDMKYLRMYEELSYRERARRAPHIFTVLGKFRKKYQYIFDEKQEKIRQWRSAKTFTDDDYLHMYAILSNIKRYQLAPKVFNNKGHFRREYARLNGIAKCLPEPQRDTRHQQHAFRARHRRHMAYVSVEGKTIFCSAYETYPPDQTRCIMVSFTRSSGRAPHYGLAGMFQRAQRASDAFANILEDHGIVKLAIPRVMKSSRKAFFGSDDSIHPTGKDMDELWAVLNASQTGRVIYLLSVGLDGFTTRAANIQEIAKRWPQHQIYLVIVVPWSFPASRKAFPTYSNGIRYGVFSVADISRTMAGEIQSSPIQLLLRILRRVTAAKEHVKYKHFIEMYTKGRGSFRVHPDTRTKNGIDVVLTKSALVEKLDESRRQYT